MRRQFPMTISYQPLTWPTPKIPKVCGACGAMVIDTTKHNEWHKHYHIDQSGPQGVRS